MRVVTYNVNGVRALSRKGGVERLCGLEADVILLQEIRASEDQLHEALKGRLTVLTAATSEQPGRNGVAVCTTLPGQPDQVTLGGFESEGRWVESVIETPHGRIRFVSVYVPSGEADTPKQEHKLGFLETMSERMQGLAAEARAGGMQTIVAGDINIARTDADLKNWKGQRGKSGCTSEERAHLEAWSEDGWVDVVRHIIGPDAPGPYTWWSQRGRAFDNDTGWRIDYVWATPGIAARASGTSVDRPPSWGRRWSDHAALSVDFRA